MRDILEYRVNNFSFEVISNFFESTFTIDRDTFSFFLSKYFFVCFDNIRLCFSDEYTFVVSGHLFSLWRVDEGVDEIKTKERSFRFFFCLCKTCIFFHGSFFETSERLIESNRKLDRNSIVK